MVDWLTLGKFVDVGPMSTHDIARLVAFLMAFTSHVCWLGIVTIHTKQIPHTSDTLIWGIVLVGHTLMAGQRQLGRHPKCDKEKERLTFVD